MDVREHDGARVEAADHELRRPDAQMQRPAEGRPAQHRDPLAGNEAQSRHPLGGHSGRVDRGDGPGVIGSEMVEREIHRRDRLLMILIIRHGAARRTGTSRPLDADQTWRCPAFGGRVAVGQRITGDSSPHGPQHARKEFCIGLLRCAP